MKKRSDFIQLSASDLSNFLSCNHITTLDRKVIDGFLSAPEWNNPHVAALQQRGFQHESNYISYLESLNLTIATIPEDVSSEEAFGLTLEKMKEGVDIIVQGVLKKDEWYGKCDVLKKVPGKSSFGEYSYEVVDTKLSRETKAGAILQLCLYSELVQSVSGSLPERMYVVTPVDGFTENEYLVSDYQSYYRLVRSKLIDSLKSKEETYPEPVSSCDICRWFESCNKQRRDDDHLCFVAGLTSSQRKDLKSIGIETLEAFANVQADFYKQLDLGNHESIQRAKEQARIQLEARKSGKPGVEFLEVFPEKGFNRLPEPTEGDIFFDLEGDQFYGDNGIEYLWGFSSLKDGKISYEHKWAFDFSQEKDCFEWFVDHVINLKKTFPRMKVYHYSSYEPGALKRLMSRYGSKESEIDHLLRTETFVDLYSIVRQSIRAGVESYSLKDLEQFYKYERQIKLRDVGVDKRLIEHSLELGNLEAITDGAKETVRLYNQDDTDSTLRLREWLEGLREQVIKSGQSISRPAEQDGEISEELDEHLQRLNALKESLQEGISVDPKERNEEEAAKWLLGDLIGFYRREDKVNFWEKFRLRRLDSLELLEDKSGLSGLRYIENIGGTARCPIQRYRFIDQAADLKRGCPVFREGILDGQEVKPFGTIEEINYEENYIDIKKRTGSADFHPNSFWAWQIFNRNDHAERLFELATFVIENGINSEDPKYRAARGLILRNNPKLSQAVSRENGSALDQLKSLALVIDNSYLAIQGPPGTGKSYSASRVILQLVQGGYKVGVTGLSHAVISNLINKVQEASNKENISVNIFQKTKPEYENNSGVTYIQSSGDARALLNQGNGLVLGGTDFMWAGNQFTDSVDYLVVDEAGQFSLVGITSIAHATKNIILLGDGAQLKQPIQGAHPDGCEVSALDHIVGDHKTLPDEKGVFLPVTYRLHPEICKFNSEQFYENRLYSVEGNENQIIDGPSNFSKKQLCLVEANHWGNSNYSSEEVDIVKKIVDELVSKGHSFVLNKEGTSEKAIITHEHIKIVCPYNAQVHRMKEAMPTVSIGTVDKFQGQEAPIVIYSVTTSSPEDAPRGMEFLYSGNRLNVAVSRAQCLFIMVANPKIFEPECKTPRQMNLANAFCRFKEMADVVQIEV